MFKTVRPSFLSGTINAPPSKSMTQRAIAAALLAEGRSVIVNPSFCNDSRSAAEVAEGLGAEVEVKENELWITGGRKVKSKNLNCGESGLAVRMFSPISALYDEELILTGEGSLLKRPMSMITDALEQLGVKCNSSNGYLPVSIKGPIKGGKAEIDGSLSSQLLSGLLMALPNASGDSLIKVRNLKSKPYIDMTIEILNDFGAVVENRDYETFRIPGRQKFTAREYTVEGDWSGGAFLLIAGVINGHLRVTGLRTSSKQSDMAVLDALGRAGANIYIGDGFIEASKSELKAFEFDATESPDLFPPLVALASYCRGKSSITGVSRLIHKESNRAEALASEFVKMGIEIEIKDDCMKITGGQIKGAQVSSHGDHRIAIAEAVAALGGTGEIMIDNPDCVAKSYPDFFEDMRKAGAKVS
ncbi:MAG: 3-phosphoshikimate 1-carboxyvinyltransferase, partial [Bacteroidales bacterium]|nr:3-phosphoshikimate 1-carboxyvinyltransferase [Bacteroidales bacterium]